MTTPEPAEPITWEPEHRALMLQTVIGELGKELADIVKDLKVAYPRPRTVPFESPLDGAALGYVQRARSEPEWAVTSTEQVQEYFTREFPAVLEAVFLLDVPGHDKPVVLPEDHPVTVALAGSAPELLTPVQRVPPQVVEDALQDARDNGRTDVPGINLQRKVGNLNVVYDKKSGPAAIGRLVRNGLLDYSQLGIRVGDGRSALPAVDEREAS